MDRRNLLFAGQAARWQVSETHAAPGTGFRATVRSPPAWRTNSRPLPLALTSGRYQHGCTAVSLCQRGTASSRTLSARVTPSAKRRRLPATAIPARLGPSEPTKLRSPRLSSAIFLTHAERRPSPLDRQHLHPGAFGQRGRGVENNLPILDRALKRGHVLPRLSRLSSSRALCHKIWITATRLRRGRSVILRREPNRA
jgi:hypothetical protein